MLFLDLSEWCETNGQTLDEVMKAWLGCGRGMAGWKTVSWSMCDPDESGTSNEQSAGSI